jgi:hypothetical protein
LLHGSIEERRCQYETQSKWNVGCSQDNENLHNIVKHYICLDSFGDIPNKFRLKTITSGEKSKSIGRNINQKSVESGTAHGKMTVANRRGPNLCKYDEL